MIPSSRVLKGLDDIIHKLPHLVHTGRPQLTRVYRITVQKTWEYTLKYNKGGLVLVGVTESNSSEELQVFGVGAQLASLFHLRRGNLGTTTRHPTSENGHRATGLVSTTQIGKGERNEQLSAGWNQF